MPPAAEPRRSRQGALPCPSGSATCIYRKPNNRTDNEKQSRVTMAPAVPDVVHWSTGPAHRLSVGHGHRPSLPAGTMDSGAVPGLAGKVRPHPRHQLSLSALWRRFAEGGAGHMRTHRLQQREMVAGQLDGRRERVYQERGGMGRMGCGIRHDRESRVRLHLQLLRVGRQGGGPAEDAGTRAPDYPPFQRR